MVVRPSRRQPADHTAESHRPGDVTGDGRPHSGGYAAGEIRDAGLRTGRTAGTVALGTLGSTDLLPLLLRYRAPGWPPPQGQMGSTPPTSQGRLVRTGRIRRRRPS